MLALRRWFGLISVLVLVSVLVAAATHKRIETHLITPTLPLPPPPLPAQAQGRAARIKIRALNPTELTEAPSNRRSASGHANKLARKTRHSNTNPPASSSSLCSSAARLGPSVADKLDGVKFAPQREICGQDSGGAEGEQAEYERPRPRGLASAGRRPCGGDLRRPGAPAELSARSAPAQQRAPPPASNRIGGLTVVSWAAAAAAGRQPQPVGRTRQSPSPFIWLPVGVAAPLAVGPLSPKPPSRPPCTHPRAEAASERANLRPPLQTQAHCSRSTG